MSARVNEFRRRKGRRLWFVGATLVAAIAFGIVFAAASGANLAGSTFEGSDGNLTVDTAGNTDWSSFASSINCATGVGCLVDTPSGASDNAFTQGTNEDDPAVHIDTGSVPDNKSDLTRAYLKSEVVGGNTYLYLAWERAVNTGNANFDFELNQVATAGFTAGATGALTITRTAGDILITYDYSPSDGSTDIALLRWLTSGHGDSAANCYSANKLPCWGGRVDMSAAGFAEAGVNQAGAVSDPILGANVGASLFGEAALNLSSTQLNVFQPNTCKAFGSMFVKSRSSGSSFTAELKDFIAPSPIFVSNCGSIELKKHWVGTPDSVSLNIGSSPAGTQVASKTATSDDTTGAKLVENGTYYVSEPFTTPANASNYDSSLACTNNDAGITPQNNGVPVSVGDKVVCTFTNSLKPGTLTVIKHVINDNGGTAVAHDFTMTVTGTSPSPASFAGAESPGTNVAIQPGTYSVAESGPTGYAESDSADCSGTIALGQTKTCTITNNDVAAKLVVIKHVINDNGGTAVAHDFTMTVTGSSPSPASFAGAESPGTNVALSPGSYSVAESGPAGYAESNSADCSGTIAVGQTKTCTITNDDVAPTITINKRVVPPTDTGKFAFVIDPGEGQIVRNNGGDGYGNGDSTGAVSVSPGVHTIAESGNGTTDASAYGTTWSCSNEQTGAGRTIDLSALHVGDNVVCTFTNTKLAILIVKKVVDNSNGGGTRGPGDFSIHVTTGGLDLPNSPAPGSSAGTTYSALLPGLYTVVEDAVSGYSLTSNTCAGGVNLAPGATVTCTLTNTSGAPPPPPPPAPPAPKIDLAITKTAAPSPVTLGAPITWTMIVTNNGPNTATGVTVADPLPIGVSFVSVATSQGTCVGGALISCSLGTMPVGTSVTITLVTGTTTTGTITNTATTVGNEQETNTTNNTATATDVVNGAFVPPVKPVTFCTAVAVSPKTLFAGRPAVLTIHVQQHGKDVAGVRVRIKGSTLGMLTKPTNAKGVVKTKVQPKKAGIVTFTPVSGKSCTNARIGVTGVFTPPVTG